MGKVTGVILAIEGFLILVFFGWTTFGKQVSAKWAVRRARRRGGHELLDLLVERASILHMLFGNGTVMTQLLDTPAGHVMAVGCRSCGQMNRLVSGFEGACCGKCKAALVVPEWGSSRVKPS